MNKSCPECGGRGYYQFDTSDVREDETPMYIDLCCDLCQGEGNYDIKSTKLFVKVYKEGKILKRLFFDIQDTVNRPNNPEWYEILDTYLLYHYGTDNYECEEIEEIVEIDNQWNVENYR